MAFLVSPGVNTSEIDLTTSVPAVGTSTGATVGVFRWGPANTIIQVSSESDLVQKFSEPDSNTAGSFISAANFLAYGNDLRVVRAVSTAAVDKANNASANASHNFSVLNDEDYFNNYYSGANTHVPFVARYTGALGNSLKVEVCAKESDFASWAYAPFFDAAPNTSNYAASVTGQSVAKDELHIIVVDEDGTITGTANTVLERWANLSKASDARGDDGSSIYYKEVLYRNSQWIHWLGHVDSANGTSNGNTWGVTIATANARTGNAFFSPALTSTKYSLSGGTDGVITQADIINGIDLLNNAEKVDISLLFAGDCGVSANSSVSTSTIANQYLTVAAARKDCVAFVSPAQANVVGSQASATAVVNYRNALTDTSYGVMDSGWKYQYDKYNDVYRWVPLNADIAGLCVRTDLQRDPWFSPAGLNRGQIRNLVKLALNPTQSERDTLYKGGVNPVVSFPGEGTVLFGDKTLQGRPSAFDRINVRRLFIVLEKAISAAARSSLFEFNDEFTRSQFVALVEPFLRDVQGRRGIYDFRVVCDESNNTPGVIDRNEFVGDIYIKPARSVNFIQLNFVAVRSGVAFDEIVGRF
jgi:phage tail sheath protein FI